MDEEIPTWMRLFALYRSCTLKSYAHLCTQISRAPWRPLSDWHAGRPAVAPCMSSQWGGLAGVVPVRRVGQCLGTFTYMCSGRISRSYWLSNLTSGANSARLKPRDFVGMFFCLRALRFMVFHFSSHLVMSE